MLWNLGSTGGTYQYKANAAFLNASLEANKKLALDNCVAGRGMLRPENLLDHAHKGSISYLAPCTEPEITAVPNDCTSRHIELPRHLCLGNTTRVKALNMTPARRHG